MGLRRVCDRCGKDVYPRRLKIGPDISLEQKLEMYGIFHKKYDLCYDCYEKLKDWLKGEKEE